mmetsp:Transcript_21442/g.42808  ORF Transcript_21442/g.42808 Transcript_21442/m.42808 type:complete len:81 (+) Transcript_21442:349-591(+)
MEAELPSAAGAAAAPKGREESVMAAAKGDNSRSRRLWLGGDVGVRDVGVPELVEWVEWMGARADVHARAVHSRSMRTTTW